MLLPDYRIVASFNILFYVFLCFLTPKMRAQTFNTKNKKYVSLKIEMNWLISMSGKTQNLSDTKTEHEKP